MATKTTKKKKPKCTKGTACGYSCIAGGKVCRQPVPKDVAEDGLSAIPARGKKADKKKAKAEPRSNNPKRDGAWAKMAEIGVKWDRPLEQIISEDLYKSLKRKGIKWDAKKQTWD